VLMQDIKAYPMLLELWREMTHDLMPLMHHIVRATKILAVRRDPDDRHNSPSSTTCSSSTPLIDEGGCDPPPPPSPHPDHDQETHIPPPPILPHLDEQEGPIPPPLISG